MYKQVIIGAVALGGLLMCVLAPPGWRLVGAFCVGGGCFVLVEVLRQRRIDREIKRYDMIGQDISPARHVSARARNRVRRARISVSRAQDTIPNAIG